MKKIFALLLLVSPFVVSAQKKFNEAQQKIVVELEAKKKEFKASANDSLFLAQNSDKGYYKTILVRGDQAEDIEEQIFNAKPGDVVGPFDGENSFYLLKIIRVDSLQRTKAKKVQFFPRGEYTGDTAKFSKLVSKYVETIRKGKEYGKIIMKEENAIGVRNKGVQSFWLGQSRKENYDLAFDRKIDNPYVKRVGNEIEVLYILEEKRNAPFSVEALLLVKKLK